jgi:hypothetical protein
MTRQNVILRAERLRDAKRDDIIFGREMPDSHPQLGLAWAHVQVEASLIKNRIFCCDFNEIPGGAQLFRPNHEKVIDNDLPISLSNIFTQ